VYHAVEAARLPSGKFTVLDGLAYSVNLQYLKELLETRGSRCARCNEAIIPMKKLLGKEKKS
jgi:hypothetical protein